MDDIDQRLAAEVMGDLRKVHNWWTRPRIGFADIAGFGFATWPLAWLGRWMGWW